MKSRGELSDAAYQPYFDHFDADLYDPRDWARRAKAAGMKYVVLTAKHHEGFCLWDTQQTDFKVTNTPHGRDLLTPFVEAFRAEGLKIGTDEALDLRNAPVGRHQERQQRGRRTVAGRWRRDRTERRGRCRRPPRGLQRSVC